MDKDKVKAAIEQLYEDATAFVSEMYGPTVNVAMDLINESITTLNDELGLDIKLTEI